MRSMEFLGVDLSAHLGVTTLWTLNPKPRPWCGLGFIGFTGRIWGVSALALRI